MALDAGELTLNLEYATDLKDKDWFGKQDPYCILTCGQQNRRSKTARDGGKNPVWNETFKFNIINENDVAITVKDEDVFKDDNIGTARVALARAREVGHDRLQVPVMSRMGKQRGFVHVSLTFARNSAMRPGGMPQQPQYGGPPAAYGAPPPQYGMPQHGTPPPGPYGAPSFHQPPQPYGAPSFHQPAPYGAPYGAAPPQPGYGAPPAAHQPGSYSAPPAAHQPGSYSAPPAAHQPGSYAGPPAGYPGMPPAQAGYGAPPPNRAPAPSVYPQVPGHYPQLPNPGAVPGPDAYPAQQRQLQEMGFTNVQANIAALHATGGNVNAAVERLC